MDDVLSYSDGEMRKAEFARVLWNEIMDRNMTQAGFARECGLDRALVTDFVRGKRMPTPDQLRLMGSVLGVDFSRFLPH